MRALIVGYGRMGKLVASLCPEYGFEVAGTVDVPEAGGRSDGRRRRGDRFLDRRRGASRTSDGWRRAASTS